MKIIISFYGLYGQNIKCILIAFPETKAQELHLKDYFPKDAETFGKIGENEIEEFKFFKTSSLSRRYIHCKGVYPIFALSAIHNAILEPLFRRLSQPVFTISSAPIISIREAAHTLYQVCTYCMRSSKFIDLKAN